MSHSQNPYKSKNRNIHDLTKRVKKQLFQLSRYIKNMTLDDFASAHDSLDDATYLYLQKQKQIKSSRNKQPFHEESPLHFYQLKQYESHLRKPFPSGEYMISIHASYHHVYFAAEIHNCQRIKVVTIGPTISLKKLFSTLFVRGYTFDDDIDFILEQLKWENSNLRMETEIDATAAYFKRSNLLPGEVMRLIEGYGCDIRPIAYLPLCICRMIKQYYVRYIYEYGCADIVSFEYIHDFRRSYWLSTWPPRDMRDVVVMDSTDHSCIIYNFQMNSGKIYIFKFKLVDNCKTRGTCMDVMVGITSDRSFKQYKENNPTFECFSSPVQWIPLNTCKAGDVIEVIYDLREKRPDTSAVYVYTNGLYFQCDDQDPICNLDKDTYYPCICNAAGDTSCYFELLC